jgi:tetratricopeptide (TPR) repeat protein
MTDKGVSRNAPDPRAARAAQIEAGLRRAIKARPDAPDGHFRLGLLLQQLGRSVDAEKSYRAALRLAPGHLDAVNNLSLVLEQRGNPGQAERLLRDALATHPEAGLLHCNLGRILMAAGRLDEAASAFTPATKLPTVAAAARYGLATIRQRQDRLVEAEEHYRAALAGNPGLVDARNDLGVVLRRLGRDDEAEDCFRRAIAGRADYAAAHLNLGALLLDRDRLDDAAAAFERARTLQPDWADAHYYCGVVQKQRRDLAAAEAALSRAVTLNPAHEAALNQLGVIFESSPRLAEAESMFRRAMAAAPNYLEARLNLASLLSRLRRDDEALALVEKAAAIAPDSADVVNNRGVLWELQADLENSLACYERALVLAPDHADANFNRGRLWLQLDRWHAGWEGYEWRLRNRRDKRQFFETVMWDGTPLQGKTIILHSEQGFGDTLQFCRYAPMVAARGGTVVLAVQPALRDLVGGLPGVAQCIGVGSGLPPYDYLMPLASLPHLFDTGRATIPTPEGYLKAPPDRLERWRRRFAEPSRALRIGLAWAGNAEQSNDRNRSTSLAAFLPLLDLPGTEFYSLQVGQRAAEIGALPGAQRLVDLSPELSDFAETAAAMTALDLIVTVDTSVAHLAGALGRPAFVALTYLPDWRWYLTGSDNPWYASLRVFRQPSRRDWASVVTAIAAALRERVAERATAAAPSD